MSRAILNAAAGSAAGGVLTDLVSIEGTLVRHRYTRDTWGIAQFHVEKAPDGVNPGASVTIVGATVGAVAPGASLRLTGQFEQHREHGLQLKVERLENLGVRTGWAAANWLLRLDGVGRVLADRLACAFPGEQLLDVLNAPLGDGEEPLLTVKGISAAKAVAIRESWAAVGQVFRPEDLRYLEGELGLTRWETQSVLSLAKKKGTGPRGLLEQEPYSLTELRGWGFPRADRVALKAGMERNAPARLEAAALHVLRQTCNDEGHTALTRKQLVSGTAELIAADAHKVAQALSNLVTKNLVLVSEEQGRELVADPDLFLAERQILKGALRGAS